MNSLYLLFEIGFDGIVYTAVNDESQIVYEGTCEVPSWSPKSVRALFEAQILTKLRGHGKVFSSIGIVVPYAPATHSKPEPATPALLKQLIRTASEQQFVTPVGYVLQASLAAWPHLPHFFLYDTCLSSHITRQAVIPPFRYDFIKQFGVHPMLLHSYGHKANVNNRPSDQPVISVYMGNQVSVALFSGEKILDAMVSYSPLSSIMGLNGPGVLDIGFVTDVAAAKSFSLTHFVHHTAGLSPMIEGHYSLDDLCEIAGLSPKKGSVNYDAIPIESLEWMELAIKNFVRSLRHAVGAMAVHPSQPQQIIINASMVPKTSGVWTELTKSFPEIACKFESTSLLQAASLDLIQITK